MSAMRACGLAGYRNDSEFAMGRYLRDILSSPIMINNDRILANAEPAVLMSEVPTGAEPLSATRSMERQETIDDNRAATPRPADDLAGSSARRVVPADRRRRRLRPHRPLMRTVVEALGALISRHRGIRRRSPSFSAGRQPRADREVGLSQELPASARLRLRARAAASARSARRSIASTPAETWTDALCSRAISCSRRPPAIPLYPIAAARGAVPGRRADLRRRLRLLPPRAVARHRPAAVVPHARIRLHRRARAGRGVPRRLEGARRESPTRSASPIAVEPASDPFFGRGGAMVGRSQVAAGAEVRAAGPGALGGRADRLHELQLPSRPFRPDLGHRNAAGEPAHTACVAFGMDRLAVALFATHGADPAQWPAAVRTALSL